MRSPLEILTREDWDSTLFFSYPLSLSFYESQIHKEGFASTGCRDIQIVCDPDGYEMCLSERRSTRVGAEYQVAVAGLPRGVFHPKLILLRKGDEFTASVASGNLTFGGFGRNIEVFHYFQSPTCPSIFGQIREFISALTKRKDLIISDTSWAQAWIEHLEGFPIEAEGTFLLNSVDMPLSDQLLEVVLEHDGAKEIRILSPFFDNDANGIIRLAKTLDARQVTIGSLSEGDNFIAPFPQPEIPSISFQMAKVPFEDGRRCLHAKWFEIECVDGVTLLVSGSMNSTRQSMLTTNNIELVSVVKDSGDCLMHWKHCPWPKESNVSEFLPPGVGKRALINATLKDSSFITGRIQSIHKVEGEWKMELLHPSQKPLTQIVWVDADGVFRFQLTDLNWINNLLGVRLSAKREELKGECWVDLEDYLELNRQGSISVVTINRILSGTIEHDEVTELIAYLSQNAERHLIAFERPATGTISKKSASEEETNNDQTKHSTALLEELTFHGEENPGDHWQKDTDDEDSARIRVLNRLIHKIRTRIAQQKTASHDVTDSPVQDGSLDDDETKENAHKQKNMFRTRDTFNKAMERILLSAKTDSKRNENKRLSSIFNMWLEGNLSIAKVDKEKDKWLLPFCKHWFNKVTEHVHLDGRNSTLQTHFAHLAIYLIDYIQKDENRAQSWEIGLLLAKLEGFVGDGKQRGIDFIKRTTEQSEDPFLTEFLPSDMGSDDLERILESVESIPSLNRQIILTDNWISGKVDAKQTHHLPFLQTKPGLALASEVRNHHRIEFKAVNPNHTSCPSCYKPFNHSERISLTQHHLVRCIQCQSFIAKYL